MKKRNHEEDDMICEVTIQVRVLFCPSERLDREHEEDHHQWGEMPGGPEQEEARKRRVFSKWIRGLIRKDRRRDQAIRAIRDILRREQETSPGQNGAGYRYGK